MEALAALKPVAGVRSRSSLGVDRYCRRLARALQELGVDYTVESTPRSGRASHFHLANSSRRSLFQALGARRYALTVHDVRPRTHALDPLYRGLVYPAVVERSTLTIVHSRFAADLLSSIGVRPPRLEIVPHPAPQPASVDRSASRAALRISDDRLVAVLPGVIKRAKLVREAIEAVARLRDDWLIVLAGHVRDRRAAAEARAAGAIVVEAPDDPTYENAIVAADAVLCLRLGSVGESNGPLLDALGAARPLLATETGSIPETALDAARYVEPTSASIAAGLQALADPAERAERARHAAARAAVLTWESSARAHAKLFAEAFDG